MSRTSDATPDPRGLRDRVEGARDTLGSAWSSYSPEFAPRAVAHRGRSSLRTRGNRLRSRVFFIVQCAISAAIAWFIARELLGHPQPFFAPIATLVALGQSYGQRLERAVAVVFGVAIGVLIGDTLIHYLGSGYWQLALIITLTMATATFLDGNVLTVTQAGVQSAFVTMIVAPPGEAFSRWTDAVVGGLVALLAATITPAAPLRRPRQHTAGIVRELAAILQRTAVALRTGDLEAITELLTRARHSEDMLSRLESLAADGLSVVRSSPFRRRQLPAVQAIADLLEPLDRATRNIRVLVRRAHIAVRGGEVCPKAYIDMVEDLATVATEMAATLDQRLLPTGALPELVELAERTTYVASRPSLSSEVIRAQVRSIIVDLLMVAGLPYDTASGYVPHSYELDPQQNDPDDEDPDERTMPIDRAHLHRSLTGLDANRPAGERDGAYGAPGSGAE